MQIFVAMSKMFTKTLINMSGTSSEVSSEDELKTNNARAMILVNRMCLKETPEEELAVFYPKEVFLHWV